VNHLNLVGWINTAQYKWAELIGKEIKFRPATFYLGVADMLAGEVEGQPKQQEEDGDTERNEAGRGVDLAEDNRPIEGASDGPTTQRTSDDDTSRSRQH
jgi:triacylglycerol lipase